MNTRSILFNLGLILLPLVAVHALWWEPAKSAVERGPVPAANSERIKFEILLAQVQPEVVLLGTSVVRKNFNVVRLSDRLGKKTVKVARDAVGSAWMYLTLKNVILKADPLPETVVVCFRNYNLTIPDYRVWGRRKWLIDDMAGDDEPWLDRLAYLQGMDGPHYALYRWSRAYRERIQIRERVDGAVKSMVGSLLGAGEGVDEAIGRVFANERMRVALLNEVQAVEPARDQGTLITDFNDALPRSFLPEMIHLAKEKSVQLVFLRMKTRKHATPGKEGMQSKQLLAYIHNMRQYLESRGLNFIDFTDDPRIQYKHYDYNDYFIKGTGTRFITDLLAERLEEILGD